MIVRLNHYGQRAVRARVPELHAQAMLEHRVARGKTMHDVELPPIAWRQILDIMREQCFGPMGGRLDRGVPKSAYSAIKKIAEAVMRIENHPALTGKAVEGWLGDVVLLWCAPAGPQLWSVYPFKVEGVASCAWFWPEHRELHGRRITLWRQVDYPPSDAYSLDPYRHTEFFDWAQAQSSPSI